MQDANKHWHEFHVNLLKTTDSNKKQRLKDELNSYISFKLKQISDSTKLPNIKLTPAHEELLAKNSISTEDIKASRFMFLSDIESSCDYLSKIKYWLNVPEKGWPDQLDEGLDKLAAMNVEMVNSGIYSFNELVIEMPETAQEAFNKFLPMLTNYTAEMDFHATKKQLEAKQGRSMQKCNTLLQDYAAIVGNENMKVEAMKNKLDSLKSNKKKVQPIAFHDQRIDSMKEVVAGKKEALKQKQTELDSKKQALRDSYKQILQKCSFDKSEDPGMMWGKILHLAQFGYSRIVNEKNNQAEYQRLKSEAQKAGKNMNTVKPFELTITVKEVFSEVQKRLDLYLAYNKTKDLQAILYVPAAKQYYKLISEKKLQPLGILMVGTDNNIQHPFLRTGDVVIERKGKKVDRVETYAKLKEDPNPNVLKVIRFMAGKKTILTETISPNCKVLVGMMNLWEE